MIKSIVLLYGTDGLLAQKQELADTEAFVLRVYQAMQDIKAQEKTSQFIVDLLEELCPCIDHPNGSRFEFLQI